MKKDFVLLDIETRGNYKDYQEFCDNDERGAELFRTKYNKLGWYKEMTIGEAYTTYSPIISTFGSICCISVGMTNSSGDKKIHSFYGDNEREILESFNKALEKIQMKDLTLCGYRIFNFDIPWLLHKFHTYRIIPADIINIYGKKPWELRIVDMFDDWKIKSTHTASLDDICYELGIKSPKSELDGSKVHAYYWEGKLDEIKDYCECDISVSIDISKIIY